MQVEPALTAERSGPGPESRCTFCEESKRMSGIQKEKLLTNGHNGRLSVLSSPKEKNEKSKQSQRIWAPTSSMPSANLPSMWRMVSLRKRSAVASSLKSKDGVSISERPKL